MGAVAHQRERNEHGDMAVTGSELWKFDVVLDVAPTLADH
jgi:hypothetical protein